MVVPLRNPNMAQQASVQMPAAPLGPPDSKYLAEALRQQNQISQRPISTPLGGIAQALQQGLAGYQMGKMGRDAAQRERDQTQFKMDYAQALKEQERGRQTKANMAMVNAMYPQQGMSGKGDVGGRTAEYDAMVQLAQTGQPLADPIVSEWAKSRFAGPAKLSEKEQAIRRTMQEQGVPRRVAQGLVDGIITPRTDPQTGLTSMIDQSSGKSVPVETPAIMSAKARQNARAEGRTILDPHNEGHDFIEDVRMGTGTHARIGRALDAVIGGLTNGQVNLAPEQQKATASVRAFNQFMKSALVNNPRFPAFEQEIVSNLMADPESLWINPDAQVTRIYEMKDFLERRLGVLDNLIIGNEATKNERAEANEIVTALNLLGPLPEREATAALFQSGQEAEQEASPASSQEPAWADPSGQTLKPGDIVDGMKFRGGDPNDPNSWENQATPAAMLGGVSGGGF